MTLPDGFSIRTKPHVEAIEFRMSVPAMVESFFGEDQPRTFIRVFGATSAHNLAIALLAAERALDEDKAWQIGEWPEPSPLKMADLEAAMREVAEVMRS